MKENVSGCFFSEHSVVSTELLITGSLILTVGWSDWFTWRDLLLAEWACLWLGNVLITTLLVDCCVYACYGWPRPYKFSYLLNYLQGIWGYWRILEWVPRRQSHCCSRLASLLSLGAIP